MTIEEIENLEGIKFPELFRTIYNTESMTWMTSREWLVENREQLQNIPSAFMYNIFADCEPLLFENIHEEKVYIDELEEMSGYKIKEQYTFIPFAQTGSGDMYCFVYENKEKLIHIVLYHHDVADITSYGVDFEEFLTWQLCNAVYVDGGEQNIDENILSHAKFLKDEHRKMFEDKNTKLIEEIMSSIENEMDRLDKEDLRDKFSYKINL